MCDANVATVGVHVKNSIVLIEDQTLDLKPHFDPFLLCFVCLLFQLLPPLWLMRQQGQPGGLLLN